MISGLQVAFLLFHNRVVDKLRADGEDRALAAALRPAGRATTPEREEDDRTRAVFRSAPPGDLALSLDHPQRVPAPDHRRISPERHPLAWTTFLYSAARRAEHSGGVPGRRIPLRTQPCAAIARARISPATPAVRSLDSSSIRPPRGNWILSICAAAHEAPDALSGGRRSSTLAVTSRRTCGRPRVSTRRSRARCSICRLGRLRVEIRPPRSRNGTCCAT